MSADSDDNAETAINSGDDAAARRAARRRRLDAIFGDDLPEVTRDECGQDHKGVSQDWLEAQRPPHYE